jgi:hypothetical protein
MRRDMPETPSALDAENRVRLPCPEIKAKKVPLSAGWTASCILRGCYLHLQVDPHVSAHGGDSEIAQNSHLITIGG